MTVVKLPSLTTDTADILSSLLEAMLVVVVVVVVVEEIMVVTKNAGDEVKETGLNGVVSDMGNDGRGV